MAGLFVLFCVVAAWWLAWRTQAKIAKCKGWGALGRICACSAIALLAAFSVFCITAGVLLPGSGDAKDGGPIVATAGFFLLVPLVFALWKASKSSAKESDSAEVQLQKILTSSSGSGALGIPTLPREFLFSYVDHDGQATRRRVRVMSLSSNDGRQYLDGYCLDRQAMRTFRVDRIQGDLTDMETGELVNVYLLLASTNERRKMDYSPSVVDEVWPDFDSLPNDLGSLTTVLFTGFDKAHKAELENIAIAAGWVVHSTIGPRLDYLVIGKRAGSKKLSRAKELSVTVVNEADFLSLISN